MAGGAGGEAADRPPRAVVDPRRGRRPPAGRRHSAAPEGARRPAAEPGPARSRPAAAHRRGPLRHGHLPLRRGAGTAGAHRPHHAEAARAAVPLRRPRPAEHAGFGRRGRDPQPHGALRRPRAPAPRAALDISLGNTMAGSRRGVPADQADRACSLRRACSRSGTTCRSSSTTPTPPSTAAARAAPRVDAGYVAGRVVRSARRLHAGKSCRSRSASATTPCRYVDGSQQFASLRAVFDNQTGPTIPRARRLRLDRRPPVLPHRRRRVAGRRPRWPSRTAPGPGRCRARWFHPLELARPALPRRRRRRVVRPHGVREPVHARRAVRARRLLHGRAAGQQLPARQHRATSTRSPGSPRAPSAGSTSAPGSTKARRSSTSSDAQFHTNVNAGFILESPLGPVFVGGSVGGEGRYRIYVGIGPVLRR